MATRGKRRVIISEISSYIHFPHETFPRVQTHIYKYLYAYTFFASEIYSLYLDKQVSYSGRKIQFSHASVFPLANLIDSRAALGRNRPQNQKAPKTAPNYHIYRTKNVTRKYFPKGKSPRTIVHAIL